jgi:hypothetical protein
MTNDAYQTVEFTEEAVKEYLDNAIRKWRQIRTSELEEEGTTIAVYYVDAFQSVRESLFGESLPPGS